MASRHRFSSSNSSLAMRQSLGPPSRAKPEVGSDFGANHPRRKSKAPIMAVTQSTQSRTSSRPSSQYRRHTQVLSTATAGVKPRNTSLGGLQQMLPHLALIKQAASRLFSICKRCGKGNCEKAAVGSQEDRRQQGGTRSRSSIYGQNAPSQMKKDPRPLSDKSYQVASIKKLISFLTDKNYPKMLTPRALQTPSTKEFLHIFNFMLEMIDESLTINGMNIVEDVPKVLKLLGYPFSVSKNHMLNVGSPHSWPILLGALSWLADACMMEDNTSLILFPGEHGFNDEQSTKEETEYQIEEHMYRVYMESGEDSGDYQELVRMREDVARRDLEHYQQEVVRVTQDNAELTRIIEELSKSSIPALQTQIQQNQTEYDELVQHISTQLIPQIQQTEEACNELDAAASQAEMQIEASKEKSKELEEQIRSQPMSATDARHLLQEIRDAEDMVEKNRQMKNEKSQRIGELQMVHNKSVTLLDNECRQVNDKLRRLAAVLPDATTLPPVDYNTSKRADPEVLQKLVNHAKILKHEIQTLHQRVASEISHIEGQIISGESTQSALHKEQVKKQLDVEHVQHSLDIEKNALEQRKKKFEEAMKLEQAEKHALEKQLMALQQRLQGELTAQRELAAVKKQTEAKMSTMAQDLAERTQQFQQLVVAITKFIEDSKNNQRALKKKVDELAVMFQQIRLPFVDPKYSKAL